MASHPQRRRSVVKTPAERQEEEEDKKMRAAARAMFASLFLGDSSWDPSMCSSTSSSVPPPNDSRGREGSSQKQASDPSTVRTTASSVQSVKDPDYGPSSSADPAALTGLVQQVADQVRKLIPEEPQQLKQTSLYKEAYKGIQWQRDNYMVGREYANWRVKERYRLDHATRSVQSYIYEIQYDDTALAHPQVARLAASFVPSDTVQDALRPLLVPVVTNQLYPLARQGLVGLIEGQGDNLHRVLKAQILQFLSNPQNRANIKNSTRGYISTSATTSSAS